MIGQCDSQRVANELRETANDMRLCLFEPAHVKIVVASFMQPTAEYLCESNAV